MCMNAYRCNDYEKEPCDIINENSDNKPTCFEEKPLITQTEPVAEVPCSVGLYSDADLRESIDCYRINYDGNKWVGLLKDSKDQLHFLGACNAIKWLCAELEKRI